jgi:hypothetical protein
MNLQRVYDGFIADRLTKQAGLTRYEQHHIVPRGIWEGTTGPRI